MKKLLLVCVVTFSLTASAAIGFLMPFLAKFALLDIFFNAVPKAAVLGGRTNILILGVDNTPWVRRSDTIMLIGIDTKRKAANILPIPRDTIVSIPGRGMDKINHAYAYGGAALSVQAVENFLQVSIPYYICVDVLGLERIIDELGGITVNVEKRMYYVDYAGGLYVNLYPGKQKLKGKDAVAYLRYRRDGGDFSRIKRQQKFVRTLGNRLIKDGKIFRSPGLFLRLMADLKTNLEVRQILSVAAALRESQEKGKIKTISLPGSDLMLDGIYYWQPDLLNLEKIKTRLFPGKGTYGSKKNS